MARAKELDPKAPMPAVYTGPAQDEELNDLVGEAYDASAEEEEAVVGAPPARAPEAEAAPDAAPPDRATIGRLVHYTVAQRALPGEPLVTTIKAAVVAGLYPLDPVDEEERADLTVFHAKTGPTAVMAFRTDAKAGTPEAVGYWSWPQF